MSSSPEQGRPAAPLAPKLIFIISEDWFFASHFLGFAGAAIAAGLQPVVVTRVNEHRAVLEAHGCRVVAVPIARRAFGPFAVLAAVRSYGAILRAESPQAVHCVALKSVVLGGIAARLARVPALVLAPTGLGFFWTAGGLKASVGRAGVRLAAKMLALSGGTRFLFENRDDPRELRFDPDDAPRVVIVSGAGVSGKLFPPAPFLNQSPLRVAIVARMLRQKGIVEAVEAVRLARVAGADIALDLWGEPDLANPDSLTEEELQDLARQPGVAWRGCSDDVAGVWRRSDIAMLLSHGGEGLPRSLVEASASARPILTTDVPGCRDIVSDGIEGFVTPPRDAAAAAAAMIKLAADPALRQRMGVSARRRFEAQFTDAIVNARIEALYRECAAYKVR
jgi:glycosyltransferase involved in cell wall biosynthesis